MIDPQQRVFLELAWAAIEDAGYDSESYGGLIGVYAGVSLNSYLTNLYSNRDLLGASSGFQTLIGSDKDFLPTRISYKLNLKGPRSRCRRRVPPRWLQSTRPVKAS